MEFDDVRRILQGLDLPQGGFEDVLAELDKLKGREPAVFAQRFLRRRRGLIEQARDSRAA